MALCSPAQQHLSGCLAILLGNRCDGRVFKEEGCVSGFLHVHLNEALWAEGRVCCDGDTLALGIVDESLLGQVGVVFDLKSGRADTRITEQVHDELDVEVADTNVTGKTLLSDILHCRPGLLDCSIAGDERVALVEETRGVADGRVDVFQRHGEVDDV